MQTSSSSLFVGILCLAALACPAAERPDLKAAQLAYHQAGTAVVEMINAKKIDVAAVEAKVLVMERNAAALAKAYAEKFPAGKKLIDTVVANVAILDAQGAVTGLGPMKDQSFEEIEQQWHDGAYFKAHQLGVDFEDEANEHYTDPIHTMVHPMMVLRAAISWQKGQADKDLQAMKGEMEEGLEQAEKTLETLSK